MLSDTMARNFLATPYVPAVYVPAVWEVNFPPEFQRTLATAVAQWEDLAPQIFEWIVQNPDQAHRLAFALDFVGKAVYKPVEENYDDGLIARTGIRADGSPSDQKLFYHYRPALDRHTPSSSHLLPDSLRMAYYQFGATCTWLYDYLGTILCRGPALEILAQYHGHQQTPARIRMYHELISCLGSKLRFLYYVAASAKQNAEVQNGEVAIGKAHTDQSFLTMHLYDNRPGLRFAGDGGSPWVVQPGQILVFPGDKAQRHLGIPALEHWVTAPIDEVKGRVAVVYFAHV